MKKETDRMNGYKKAFSLLFVFLLFVSSIGMGKADAACYAIRNPLAPVLEEVIWNQDGSLSAYVEVEPEYTEYMYLVFTDRRGKEKARIHVPSITKAKTQTEMATDRQGNEIQVKVKTGEIKIPKQDLDLSPGDYTVHLVVSNYDPDPDSRGITVVVSEEMCGKYLLESKAKSISIEESEEWDFPGYVEIKEGTIQIAITLKPEYAQATYSLLVIDEDGTIVKRIAIGTKNQRLSSSSLSLPSGTYEVQLEMSFLGEKVYSKAVTWVIPKQTIEFEIPSGEKFPGRVTVSSAGTIAITLQIKSSSYEYYFVVLDSRGNEVRRLLIDPRNPTLSVKNLSLTTGGYSLILEIVDPHSQQAATSLSTFYTVNQSGQIIIFIDGQLQSYNKPPVKINSRVLVPMRAVFEAFGAKVDWDEATQTVTATKDGDVIQLTIGSRIAYKNGEKITMDVPAILHNNETTMVPIRFVSEALGAKVSWDNYSNSVIITNK